MEWYMWILIVMVGSFLGNLLLRWLYGKQPFFYQNFIEKGYEDGYRDGATNVKMYYSMKSELPDITWLKENKGSLLNTREKILTSLNRPK